MHTSVSMLVHYPCRMRMKMCCRYALDKVSFEVFEVVERARSSIG